VLWCKEDFTTEVIMNLVADARMLGAAGRRLLLVEAAAPCCSECHLVELLNDQLQGARGINSWSWERLGQLYDQHKNSSSDVDAAVCTLIARRALGCHLGPSLKVFVCDCDYTLWDGAVAEDGVDGIRFHDPFIALQQRLSLLQSCGWLICLASRNDEEAVLRVFEERAHEMPLKRSQLTAWQVNWGPKSRSLQRLAAELSLGLDAFAFLDDNPAEVQEVQSNLPQVLVIHVPSGDMTAMDRMVHHHWALDVWQTEPATAEDARRTQLYKENAARRAARREAPTAAAFLQHIELQMQVRAPTEEELPRVSQLSLRTNQFNSTQLRFSSERSLQEWLDCGQRHIVGIWLSDRFGDYGLIAAGLCTAAAGQTLVVDCFTMSCRVLGRGVEHALLRRIATDAHNAGLVSLLLPVAGTKPNRRLRLFLDRVAAWLGVQSFETGPVVGYGGFGSHRPASATAADFPVDALQGLESQHTRTAEEDDDSDAAAVDGGLAGSTGGTNMMIVAGGSGFSGNRCMGDLLGHIADMGASLPSHV